MSCHGRFRCLHSYFSRSFHLFSISLPPLHVMLSKCCNDGLSLPLNSSNLSSFFSHRLTSYSSFCLNSVSSTFSLSFLCFLPFSFFLLPVLFSPFSSFCSYSGTVRIHRAARIFTHRLHNASIFAGSLFAFSFFRSFLLRLVGCHWKTFLFSPLLLIFPLRDRLPS